MEKTEIIKGLERYSVSESGVIVNNETGYVLKLYDNLFVGGYLCAQFSVDGKHIVKFVHRLVAEAFIPNPQNKPCVNHIDGDKHNNKVSNLEWCTHEENTRHAVEVLKKMGQYKTANDRRRKPVVGTDAENGNERYFQSIGDAAKALGLNKSNIIAALHGKQKTSGGMYWRYGQ